MISWFITRFFIKHIFRCKDCAALVLQDNIEHHKRFHKLNKDKSGWQEPNWVEEFNRRVGR